MDIVRLMGIEKREYVDKDTGELKSFCGLHVVYEQCDDEDDVEGKKCGSFSCPRDFDSSCLMLNRCYELQYTHFKTKAGLGARISGLLLIEEKK